MNPTGMVRLQNATRQRRFDNITGSAIRSAPALSQDLRRQCLTILLNGPLVKRHPALEVSGFLRY